MDPRTLYFRDMKEGEKRDQRVQVKNTSVKNLRIISIEANDTLIGVDSINQAKGMPIELKPNEMLDLLISIHYQWDESMIARNLKITYAGGEANEADIRIHAELQRQAPIQQKPQNNSPKGNTPQRQPDAPKPGGNDGR